MQEQIDSLTAQVAELLKTVGNQQNALVNTDAKFTANAPSGTADSANPRTERYEMRVGETEHTFQLMIDNPEKPILEVHCLSRTSIVFLRLRI